MIGRPNDPIVGLVVGLVVSAAGFTVLTVLAFLFAYLSGIA
jgi:hypothetical protein